MTADTTVCSPRATEHLIELRPGGMATDNVPMSKADEVPTQAVKVDPAASPDWLVTGFKFFPYAARQGEHWWVLRMNYDYPEHDLYTVFVDARPAVDLSGDPHSPVPLAASVGALSPCAAVPDRPTMSPEEAAAIVRPCAPFVVYGSETGDPCDWCDHLADHNPLERRPGI